MAGTVSLPTLAADDWYWRDDAACQTQDPALFFATDDERGPRKRNHEAAAKKVCATCPVQMACLQWALAVNEPFGVWGGQTSAERFAFSQLARRSPSAA